MVHLVICMVRNYEMYEQLGQWKIIKCDFCAFFKYPPYEWEGNVIPIVHVRGPIILTHLTWGHIIKDIAHS
jgi:hypothetical protein